MSTDTFRPLAAPAPPGEDDLDAPRTAQQVAARLPLDAVGREPDAADRARVGGELGDH